MEVNCTEPYPSVSSSCPRYSKAVYKISKKIYVQSVAIFKDPIVAVDFICFCSTYTILNSHLPVNLLASAMFVERKVCYSALFINLAGWHTSAVSFPLSDVILAQLACPLSDVMFCLHSEITNLSLYKHWASVCIKHSKDMFHV
jgi:hypothetical protein